MTLLELVNRVRRRLREDQVSDLTDDYSQLLVELASDIHREVIEAHDWSVFNTTAATAITAEFGTQDTTIPLTALFKPAPGVWYYTAESPQVGESLTVISADEMRRMYNQDHSDNVFALRPTYVSFSTFNSTNCWRVEVFPYNSEDITVWSRWNNPEVPITTDTDDGYEFVVPALPIYLGTLFMALNERGEELGEPGSIAERRYYDSLNTAKESDIQVRGLTNEYEFVRE